jgi:hypothetical protein
MIVLPFGFGNQAASLRQFHRPRLATGYTAPARRSYDKTRIASEVPSPRRGIRASEKPSLLMLVEKLFADRPIPDGFDLVEELTSPRFTLPC